MCKIFTIVLFFLLVFSNSAKGLTLAEMIPINDLLCYTSVSGASILCKYTSNDEVTSVALSYRIGSVKISGPNFPTSTPVPGVPSPHAGVETFVSFTPSVDGLYSFAAKTCWGKTCKFSNFPAAFQFTKPPPVSDEVEITLAWDAEGGAVKYKIYYGLASDSYTTAVDVGNVTSYPLKLKKGATYYLAATALDSANMESDFSLEISYTAK